MIYGIDISGFRKVIMTLAMLVMSLRLIAQPPLDLDIRPTPATICIGDAVTLNVDPVGGTPPYTFSWSAVPGDFESTEQNPVVSPLETTTYTVVITDAASQSVSESVTITVFPLPSPPAIDQVTQPTCAVPSGTVALSGLPGGNWILYVYPLLTEINGSGTTYSVSGLAPGSYTFAVRNLDQCLSTVSAAALVNPVPTPPDDPSATVTHQPDCSDPYGTILFTAQPGVEYSLGTGYQATSSFSGLEPGTYSLYVRLIADNTCVSIAPFSLTVIPYSGTPAAPQPGSVTQPGCITTTGSVVLGGLPAEPWTLMPGNISGNTESILVENLLPGTYNFYIILTSSGCSSRSSRVLINPQPPTPPAPAVTVVHPTCAEATGSITIQARPNATLPGQFQM